MQKFFKRVWSLIRETVAAFQEYDPVVYAAAIAFFTVFSLPSVLIIIVQVIGAIWEEETVARQLSKSIHSLIGTTSAEEIQKIIQKRSVNGSNTLVSIAGIVFLLFSATVIFGFIQKALNAIWDVKPKPKREFLKFLKDRLLSLSIIIILGFLMLVSLIIDTMLNMFKELLNRVLSAFTVDIMNVLNYLVYLVVVSFIFGLIFRFLPDAKIRWKDVGVGALVTGVLFTIGKFLIGKLLANTNIATTYGAAGSLAGILVWVFYSSLLVLIGATFTKVYTIQAGRYIRPKKHSVKVEIKEIEKEE